jgi:hypothetical protein
MDSHSSSDSELDRGSGSNLDSELCSDLTSDLSSNCDSDSDSDSGRKINICSGRESYTVLDGSDRKHIFRYTCSKSDLSRKDLKHVVMDFLRSDAGIPLIKEILQIGEH